MILEHTNSTFGSIAAMKFREHDLIGNGNFDEKHLEGCGAFIVKVLGQA